MRPCAQPGCLKTAHRGSLCWMHWRRKQRGSPMDAPARPSPCRAAWDRIEDAIHARFAAETDLEFEAARGRLRRAIDAYCDERIARARTA